MQPKNAVYTSHPTALRLILTLPSYSVQTIQGLSSLLFRCSHHNFICISYMFNAQYIPHTSCLPIFDYHNSICLILPMIKPPTIPISPISGDFPPLTSRYSYKSPAHIQPQPHIHHYLPEYPISYFY